MYYTPMLEDGLTPPEAAIMPRTNDIVFCVNHPEQQMVKNEGFSAITSVKKDGDKVSFNPSSGVPVVTYYCPQCGYIENYAAQVYGEWNG